jgi:hypothetical protein
MAAPSLLCPGAGEALGPGVAEGAAGEAVGTGEGVGDGEPDGDEPPQAASTSMRAASTAARRVIPAFWHGVPGWRFLNLPAACP